MSKITVSQLNRYIKNIFDHDFILNNVSVEGEISNFKESHGNYYFVLKDETSTINCIYFSNKNLSIEKFYDGLQVIVKGKVAVYEKSGNYSIYVSEIELSGLGKFFIELEKLKQKLYNKGMFSDIYKKKIPRYPSNIGVVTAKNGAAIKDITKTIYNKNPYSRIVLYPSQVQGKDAYKSIIKGIVKLDTMGLDVIIIGRGGGSIEDLYNFNNEELAETIFNAKTPIISAVGHEINESISDLVSDYRVATPTAAGELASFDYNQLIEDFDNYKIELKDTISHKLDSIENKILITENILNSYSPYNRILIIIEKFNNYNIKLKNIINNKYNDVQHKLEIYFNIFDKYNPLNKLKSGMVYAVNSKKKNINSVSDVKINEDINLILKNGTIKAKVLNIKKGGNSFD